MMLMPSQLLFVEKVHPNFGGAMRGVPHKTSHSKLGVISVLLMTLAMTTSVTLALPTAHLASTSKAVGLPPAALAMKAGGSIHQANAAVNVPEEELELESLKGSGAASKKSDTSLPDASTSRPVAYVKKPENEETPALSDNANSLKYGGATADLEEALANMAHIPPSKVPSLSVSSGKGTDKRTKLPGLLARGGGNFDVDYTPKDIAEYIFWMGDERGVELAINDFVEEGLITPQDAVRFLEEVKVELSLLRNRYASTVSNAAARDDPSIRGFWEMPARGLNKKDVIGSTFSNTNGHVVGGLPSSSMEQVWPSRLTFSGHERDATPSGNSVEDALDYEEIVEKIRQADTKMREVALEGIIYELARELFSTGLEQSPGTSVPRFTTFIENLTVNGNISKDLERSVLETLVQALVDAANERGLLIAKGGHAAGEVVSSGKMEQVHAKPILIRKKSIA